MKELKDLKGQVFATVLPFGDGQVMGRGNETRLKANQVFDMNLTSNVVTFKAELTESYKARIGCDYGLVETGLLMYFRVSYKNEVKLYKELEV